MNLWSINSPNVPQSISTFIANGQLLLTMWTWIGILVDLQNILFQKASRIHYSLSDHISASSGVLDFDTTSSVAGGTFQSNISLVDPSIQVSRTEKQLVEQGVSFTVNQVKNLFLHLLSPPFASPDH